MKNILVLGASGYIGSQLLGELAQQGYNVTGAARNIDYLKARTTPQPNINLVYLDLNNAEKTNQMGVVPFRRRSIIHSCCLKGIATLL